MSRSRRGFAPLGRLAAAAAMIGLIPAAAACDAGTNAPTNQFHPQSEGVDTVVHGIDIRDAFVLGSQLGGSIPAGKSAGLFLALINEGSPDKLVSVTAPGTAASVTLPGGGIGLRAQQAVYLTGPQAEIVLGSLSRSLATGQTVRVTLNFASAGRVTMFVPVLPRAGDYATFSPAPLPALSGQARQTLIPASPSSPGTASPSPSGSP